MRTPTNGKIITKLNSETAVNSEEGVTEPITNPYTLKLLIIFRLSPSVVTKYSLVDGY